MVTAGSINDINLQL